MRHQWLVWPLFAALMGFALGGSFVWGVLYSPPQQYAANDHQSNESPAAKISNDHPKTESLWVPADSVGLYTLVLAVLTGVLAFSTIGLWIVTWQSSKRQSKDMTESIDVAERALVAGERAWIRVDIEIRDDLTIDAGGLNLPLTFTLTNCGASPATHVRVYNDLLVSHPGKKDTRLEAYHRFITNIRTRAESSETVNFRSYTLFPNESKIVPVNAFIVASRLNDAVNAWQAEIDAIKPGGDDRWHYFDPFMVGCVAYHIPFDDRQHQTGFSIEIRRRVTLAYGEDHGWGMFDLDQPLVRVGDMKAINSIWGSPSID